MYAFPLIFFCPSMQVSPVDEFALTTTAVANLVIHRPTNVPSDTQIRHGMHSMQYMHVRFFGSDLLIIENKGSKIQLPKLKVASSSPLARSIILRNS